MTNKKTLEYDIVILGGGPAGLSAAIYAARGNTKTAIIDISMLGGQPSNYLEIENYPGYGMMGGFELMEKFEEHVDRFGVDKYPMEEIQNVKLSNDSKTIETMDKIFKTNAVIIASGAQARKLGVLGEKEFLGRGVSYCAVCDGAFYREKVVAVVGGGNAAVEEAMYLTKFASKVYIVHRRNELRADKIVQQRAFNNAKIEFIWDSVVEEIQGTNTVEKAIIKNVNTKEISELKTDGVFPYVGFSPNVESYNGQIEQDKTGFIITDATMKTSIDGVYAAGDIRVTPLRQVITAASDGAIAATSAVKYLETVESTIKV